MHWRITMAKGEPQKEPETANTIMQHVRLYRALMSSVQIVCHEGAKHSTSIAVEWPKMCDYWKDPVLQYVRTHP